MLRALSALFNGRTAQSPASTNDDYTKTHDVPDPCLFTKSGKYKIFPLKYKQNPAAALVTNETDGEASNHPDFLPRGAGWAVPEEWQLVTPGTVISDPKQGRSILDAYKAHASMLHERDADLKKRYKALSEQDSRSSETSDPAAKFGRVALARRLYKARIPQVATEHLTSLRNADRAGSSDIVRGLMDLTRECPSEGFDGPPDTTLDKDRAWLQEVFNKTGSINCVLGYIEERKEELDKMWCEQNVDATIKLLEMEDEHKSTQPTVTGVQIPERDPPSFQTSISGLNNFVNGRTARHKRLPWICPNLPKPHQTWDHPQTSGRGTGRVTTATGSRATKPSLPPIAKPRRQSESGTRPSLPAKSMAAFEPRDNSKRGAAISGNKDSSRLLEPLPRLQQIDLFEGRTMADGPPISLAQSCETWRGFRGLSESGDDLAPQSKWDPNGTVITKPVTDGAAQLANRFGQPTDTAPTAPESASRLQEPVPHMKPPLLSLMFASSRRQASEAGEPLACSPISQQEESQAPDSMTSSDTAVTDYTAELSQDCESEGDEGSGIGYEATSADCTCLSQSEDKEESPYSKGADDR